jgi:Arc/MetJ-type ribon-helix-helix transcriptional regulator
MNISMHFEGYIEKIIKEAVQQGVAKTKAEALRTALLELNDKYALVPSLDELENMADMEEISKIESRLKAGKEKVHKVRDIEKLLK